MLQLLVVLIIAVGAFIGIYLLRSSQDIREEAAPSTSLSMTTNTTLIHPGQSFSVNVNATPGNNQVIGVQLDISFDPRYINVSDVTLGTFLPGQVDIVKKEIDNVAGTIFYVVWINPATRVYATAPGLVATIIASAPLSSTPNTQITFGSGTLVASLEDPGNNVVQNLTNLSLVVGTPTPTPTSTPTPTRTPTPTFTNTPTPTFTNTPTPTIALRPDLTVFIPSAGVVGNSLFTFTTTVSNNGTAAIPLVPLLGCIQLTARQVDVLTRIIH